MQYVVIGVVAAAVSYAMSYAMAQEQKITNEGSRVDDLKAIGSKYNEGVPLAFGLNRLPMNVVWARPLREERVTTTQKTGGGGKGGGGGTKITTVNYYYYATFGGVLARGVQNRPLRIWFDKRLVWEAPAGQRVLSGALGGGGNFEFLTGAADQNPPTIAEAYLGVGNTPGYRGSCTMFFHNVPVEQYGNRIPSVEVEVAQTAPGLGATAADIIQAVCREVGVDPQYIDTSEVDRDVAGMKIEPGQAAAYLEDLLTVLHLQSTFSEGRLKFRPIEQPVVMEIPESDLILKSKNLFPVSRVREDDLPRVVSVEYIDPDRDYQPNNQRVIRQNTSSRQEISVSANVAMSAGAAARCADVLMYRAWAARNRFGSFYLPRKYLCLEPGDVVGISVEGERHLVRLTSLDIGADLSLKVEGESYDPVVLTGLAAGDSGAGFPGQGLPHFGSTRYMFMDLPALSPAEADQTGFYFAACGEGLAWRGAVLERSADQGANWEAAGVLPVYSLMGECVDTLPPPPPEVGHYQWDHVSTVTVDLIKGELASTTLEQIYAGGNTFIVGREMIQALTVTSLGQGRYRLSDLLRGRRGTEEAMHGHGPYEDLALADGLLFVPVELDARGVDLRYRVTPFGSTDYVEHVFASQGLTARPRRPVLLSGWRDGEGSLHLQWYGTSRKSTELPNTGEQPAEYEPLRFRLKILDDAGREMRSMTVETEGRAVYSLAAQHDDFGSVQPSVRFAVEQWSPLAGWGEAAEAVA